MTIRSSISSGLNKLAVFIEGEDPRTNAQVAKKGAFGVFRGRGQTNLYDKVLYPTTSTPAARQTYELRRARDESRNMYLTSPIWAAFVNWAKVQVLGNGRARLAFPLIDRENHKRLEEAIRMIRAEWQEFSMQKIGSRGETLGELAAHALHHRLVDGDAFLILYNKGRNLSFYPGDALVEEDVQHLNGPRNRALGITYDDNGKAVTYHFANSEKFGPIGVWSYGFPTYMDVPASRVLHIRDRRGNGSTLRSYPVCLAAIDDLSRITEIARAFTRSAVRRASAPAVLQRNLDETFSRPVSYPDAASQDGDSDDSDQKVPLPEYLMEASKAGDVVTLADGYSAADPFTVHPNADEHQQIIQIELRICAALGVSRTTLLGDMASTNFSASQQNSLQETEKVTDLQLTIIDCLYRPVFGRFFKRNWYRWLRELPGVTATDMAMLSNVDFFIRKPAVLEVHRKVQAMVSAFNSGLYTMAMVHAELGQDTTDMDAFFSQIEEDHKRLEFLKPQMPDLPSEPSEDMDAEEIEETERKLRAVK